MSVKCLEFNGKVPLAHFTQRSADHKTASGHIVHYQHHLKIPFLRVFMLNFVSVSLKGTAGSLRLITSLASRGTRFGQVCEPVLCTFFLNYDIF